jgi:hypothetical protein
MNQGAHPNYYSSVHFHLYTESLPHGSYPITRIRICYLLAVEPV